MYLKLFFILFVLIELYEAQRQGLSYNIYEKSCPQVENLVRASLSTFFLTDPTSTAALLRLVFHDCQVNGCDASILIDPVDIHATSEMGSTRNFGIRKRELISTVKSMVEFQCPQQVSCADILVLAAREAVAFSGGPRIQVPLGRRDSNVVSSSKIADSMLPNSTLGVDGMIPLFAKMGMSTEESVAILGAHTLGITHCRNIMSRLYDNERERGESHSQAIGPGFKEFLRLNCPQVFGTRNTTFVLNDPTTLVFDNQYYINAIEGRGILTIDAEMVLDPRTALVFHRFAADQAYFYNTFSSAFVKLSSFGVLTGNQGVIRKRCNTIIN